MIPKASSAVFQCMVQRAWPLPVGPTDMRARQTHFRAACSLGKCPRALTARRILPAPGVGGLGGPVPGGLLGRRGADGLEEAGGLVPVLAGGRAGGVSWQVHDAGLHDGPWPDGFHRLGQAFESVAGRHEDVVHAAVLDLGEMCSQCMASSPPSPAHSPRISRRPSVVTARAARMGRLATAPSRIFTWTASMKTTGQTAPRGLLCHSAMPSGALSVMVETARQETPVPWTSARWACTSPVVRPFAASEMTVSPTPVRRYCRFLTIFGSFEGTVAVAVPRRSPPVLRRSARSWSVCRCGSRRRSCRPHRVRHSRGGR
ncbi:hypothetical protein RKD24_006654 [Streptomyces calvus]